MDAKVCEDETCFFYRLLLPLAFRAGLLLIQITSRPAHRKPLPLLVLHASELCLATLAFAIDDYILTFGERSCQLVGINYRPTHPQNKTITSWSVVVTTTGLFDIMINGRMHPVGFLAIVLIIAVFIDPVITNWIKLDGKIESINLNYFNVSKHNVFQPYISMGGCAIIHICTGFVAFIVVTFAGRRQINEKCMKGSGLIAGIAPILGYFLLLVWFVLLCTPNISHCDIQYINQHIHALKKYKSIVLTNSAMAIMGSIFVLLIYVQKVSFKLNTILSCMKGAIAGIITISAGIDVFHPIIAMILGMLGGTFYYFVARKLFRSPLKERDYCNMITVHLVCGLMSTLLTPIFSLDEDSISEDRVTKSTTMSRVTRQVLNDVSLLITLFFIVVAVCGVLYCFGYIRDGENSILNVKKQQIDMKDEQPIRVSVVGVTGDEEYFIGDN